MLRREADQLAASCREALHLRHVGRTEQSRGLAGGRQTRGSDMFSSHFDIYIGEHFERDAADQLAFLAAHVPIATA